MVTIENPFKYPTEQELKKEKERKYRTKAKEKKTGRKVGTWGGKRPGAGRPKRKSETIFTLNLNTIQKMNLKELGNGDIERGIQKLINDNV